MTSESLPRQLVTLGNLASDLGLAAKALREAADSGEIPCVRVGARALLFDRELVERILLERARATEPVHQAPDRAQSAPEVRHDL